MKKLGRSKKVYSTCISPWVSIRLIGFLEEFHMPCLTTEQRLLKQNKMLQWHYVRNKVSCVPTRAHKTKILPTSKPNTSCHSHLFFHLVQSHRADSLSMFRPLTWHIHARRQTCTHDQSKRLDHDSWQTRKMLTLCKCHWPVLHQNSNAWHQSQ